MPTTAKTHTVKLVPMGKTKCVRLPQRLIRKYGLENALVLEETDRGILIRGRETATKFTWEETYRAMAAESEGWDDWDATLLDGLVEVDLDPETL